MPKDFSKESRQFFAELGEPDLPARPDPVKNPFRTFTNPVVPPPRPETPSLAPEPSPPETPPPDAPGLPVDSLVPRTLYITDKQARALKVRLGLSQDPREKDMSAIVRIALDQYLADTLKMIEH